MKIGIILYSIFFIGLAVSGVNVIPDKDAEGRIVQRSGGVPSDSETRVRFIGTHDFTIAGNQTVTSDWTVPQQQFQGVDATTIISGVEFKTVGGCDGDKVSFQVVHPQAGVMDEFGTDYFVFKDTKMTMKEHRAKIPAGLIIRVIYKSTCATSARYIMNLFRYVETS